MLFFYGSNKININIDETDEELLGREQFASSVFLIEENNKLSNKKHMNNYYQTSLRLLIISLLAVVGIGFARVVAFGDSSTSIDTSNHASQSDSTVSSDHSSTSIDSSSSSSNDHSSSSIVDYSSTGNGSSSDSRSSTSGLSVDSSSSIDRSSTSTSSSSSSRVDDLINSTSTGDSNNNVRELQTELKNEGYFPSTIPATGYYGAITANAVQKYRQDHSSTSTSNTSTSSLNIGSTTLSKPLDQMSRTELMTMIVNLLMRK